MTMPFGKYIGVELRDLPEDYLDWLLTIELRTRLRNAVEEEYFLRFRRYPDAQPSHHPTQVGIYVDRTQVTLVGLVFNEGYRAVARRFHPDTGGDVQQMQVLNALAESVREQLAAAGSIR